VSIDVRMDVVTAALIGTGFTLSQTSPASNGFFSITGRGFTGSPFNDTTSGTSDAVVLAAPGNLLDPTNNDNLGRSTIALVGTAPVANMLAANLTLTASASTPPGTYTIAPTAGVSFASDDAFNDYDMSTATFTVVVGAAPPVQYLLTVIRSGTGGATGTVASSPSGINCGADCTEQYNAGTLVTLTATPNATSNFAGWSGACTNATGDCSVTMDAAKTVTANFVPKPAVQYTLTVNTGGTGSGLVSSSPAGISCPADCSEAYDENTSVTLTATPATGSALTGWSGGGCSGTALTCAVTLAAATTVNVTFTADTTPPVTTITGNPTDPSNDSAPTFTFTSSEANSTFLCSLNGATPTPCTSPTTVFVNNGAQVFTVQAIDQAGNPGNVASYSWTAAGIVAVVQPIPTLSEWALILLSLMMASMGLVAYRRRM
jgi:hypothetical protein